LLPSRGLSSAPVACSVSAMAVLNNHGTKKELELHSAFRHVTHQDLSKMALCCHFRVQERMRLRGTIKRLFVRCFWIYSVLII
jgi:hypothetical protein